MFWERFYNLCLEKGTKPLPVVKELSIATGSITKWKNGTVPNGTTLQKIADHFGVTVDYLLGNEEKALPSPAQSLNETEAELVKAFRAAAPETQDAVLRVLQIDTGRTQRKDA